MRVPGLGVRRLKRKGETTICGVQLVPNPSGKSRPAGLLAAGVRRQQSGSMVDPGGPSSSAEFAVPEGRAEMSSFEAQYWQGDEEPEPELIMDGLGETWPGLEGDEEDLDNFDEMALEPGLVYLDEQG